MHHRELGTSTVRGTVLPLVFVLLVSYTVCVRGSNNDSEEVILSFTRGRRISDRFASLIPKRYTVKRS